MSEPVGTAIICEQCEDVTFLLPGAEQDAITNLAKVGWEPYGTGVTPLAEENGKAGRFACPRCTRELLDDRLKRLASDVMTQLAAGHSWLVIRSAESPSDYLRIMTTSGSVQVEFEHHMRDREMRDALRTKIVAALES